MPPPTVLPPRGREEKRGQFPLAFLLSFSEVSDSPSEVRGIPSQISLHFSLTPAVFPTSTSLCNLWRIPFRSIPALLFVFPFLSEGWSPMPALCRQRRRQSTATKEEGEREKKPPSGKKSLGLPVFFLRSGEGGGRRRGKPIAHQPHTQQGRKSHFCLLFLFLFLFRLRTLCNFKAGPSPV